MKKLLVLAAALVSFGAEDHSAEAELASFTVLPEFEVNLFASEKEGVVKPIQIRFDARGRLWVIGSTVYPQIAPGEKPNDKVLILEDADGDGRAEKSTVFADGLMIPTGLELANGGVYLGHGTELLFLKDTDGDDKADVREVLFRGFGTGDNHQNINSFTIGPGGELWMCQGLHTHSNVETAWGIKRLHKAGIWRMRPGLGKLEGFYGSEHEPQNPWGYVFTKWGEPILIAGNNSSIIYPVPGLTREHKDLAPKLIWKNGQGRKCSGADLVETAHFPESYQGKIITGGYINNAVWVLNFHEDGSGFALDDSPPLIRSSSRNFRPVDVKFGPDGALYICDWYNPIIGHYQASFRHPDRDKTHGRIWRVTAKGRKLTTTPKVVDASIPELLKNLGAADGWTRRFSKRVLAERSRDEVVRQIGTWGHAAERTSLELKEALGVLQSVEAPNRELLARSITNTEPGLRAYAASVAGAWADRVSNPLELLTKAVEDEHPRVRLHAVVGASYVADARAVGVALKAIDRGLDIFVEYALHQTIHATKPEWLFAMRKGELDLPREHLVWLIRSDGTADTLETLRVMVKAPGATNDQMRVVLAQTGTSNDWGYLVREGTLTAELLKEIREASQVRKGVPADTAGERLARLADGKDEELAAEAVRLIGQWRVEPYRERARRAAYNRKFTYSHRAAGMEALADFGGEAKKALEALAGHTDDQPMARANAVAALTRLDLEAAARLARDVIRSTSDKSVYETLLGSFLRREGGGVALAAALRGSTVPPEFSAAAIAAMNASGRRVPELAEVLAPGGAAKRNVTTEFIRREGDARRGKLVYERQELGCVACHQVYGEGGKTGPDLSTVGSAQPIDFIVGAILEPQKEVKEGFISTRITTKGDEELQGYIARETASEVVLRDVLQGRDVTISKAEIASRTSSGSIMPGGLTDGLSDGEFADLVKYLSELGTSSRK